MSRARVTNQWRVCWVVGACVATRHVLCSELPHGYAFACTWLTTLSTQGRVAWIETVTP